MGGEGLRQEQYKEPQWGGVKFLLSFEESQKGKQSLLLFSGVKGMYRQTYHDTAALWDTGQTRRESICGNENQTRRCPAPLTFLSPCPRA